MNTTELDPRLKNRRLVKGAGSDLETGLCAMQMVSWLNGEPLSDAPKCACRVIRRFVIRCNDDCSDENRQKLLPLVPLLIGTATDDPAIRRARAYHFADFAIRTVLPWLCDKLGRAADSARLRALGKVCDRASAELARNEARSLKNTFFADAAAAAAADAAAAAAATYGAAAAATYADAATYGADAAAAAAADAAAAAATYGAAAAAAKSARSELADLCIEAIKGALSIR